MMKFPYKLTIASCAVIACLSFTSVGYADSSSSSPDYTSILNKIEADLQYISGQAQSLSVYINETINTTAKTIGQAIYTPSPDLKSTMSGNYSITVSAPAKQQASYNASSNSLGTIFTNGIGNKSILNSISSLSDSVPIPSSHTATASDITQQQTAPFNLDTLLLPSSYNQNETDDTNQFINYVTFQSMPFPNLAPKELESTTAVMQSYKAFLGTYAALQSIGTSNLEALSAERQPVSGLGTLAGMNTADASPLQVDEYNAERRTLNPQWYDQMETANPVTLSRETLYVLAEVRAELYTQRIIQERMLATMSAMQLMQTQKDIRPTLKNMQMTAQDAVLDAAKQKIKLKAPTTKPISEPTN